VFTPVYAIAPKDAAHEIRRVSVAFWQKVRHPNIATTLTFSAALHLALLFGVGVALYDEGEDDRDVAELSVQLETRDGPNSDEFTEAALPEPVPEPAQEVIEDPGTTTDSLASAEPGDTAPLEEVAPDVLESATLAAHAEVAETPSEVLTTTGVSGTSVPAVMQQEMIAAAVAEPEQVMLKKNVQEIAQKLLDTNLTKMELTWQEDGREYTARIVRQPAADSTGLEQVIAEIMTEHDGKRMKTRLSLKRLAFSHFTQLVNHWDPNILLHDDVIDGRFHSNTRIAVRLDRDVEPRFFGKVTTAAATLTPDDFSMRRRKKDVFQGGLETRTERVTLPRDMPDVVNGGEPADRHTFLDDTRVIFNSDGSFVWRAANGTGALTRVEASLRPCYLIGEKGANLYVSGTVAGIFTLYSPGDIEIENDLVYSRDPRDVVISRDFLALIAGRDVKVSPGSITGDGDLHVHAALFARRSFRIESADRVKAGRLFILGSLTAGTIYETEPRYATEMDFDRRFEYLRPASFPMTRRYEVDSWDEGWKEVKGDGSAAATPGLASSE
jgi:hypothetical protein